MQPLGYVMRVHPSSSKHFGKPAEPPTLSRGSVQVAKRDRSYRTVQEKRRRVAAVQIGGKSVGTCCGSASFVKALRKAGKNRGASQSRGEGAIHLAIAF